MRKHTEKDFWLKVEKTDNCWIWLGSKDTDGYGLFGFNRKNWFAHRLVMVFTGQDPTGLQVCHKCDNPGCVRPDHLFLGTSQDNQADKVNKNRQARGSTQGHSKLTEEKVLAIRKEFANGNVTRIHLGQKYGITGENISCIIKRKTWKHI